MKIDPTGLEPDFTQKLIAFRLIRVSLDKLSDLLERWDKLSGWTTAGLGAMALFLLAHVEVFHWSRCAVAVLIVGVGFGAVEKLLCVLAFQVKSVQSSLVTEYEKIFSELISNGAAAVQAQALFRSAGAIVKIELQPLTPKFMKPFVTWLEKNQETDDLALDKRAGELTQFMALAVILQMAAGLVAGMVLLLGSLL